MSGFSALSARFLWRFRFPLSVIVLLLTVLAGQELASLSVSNSLEIWYPGDDPELINYRRFQETYGSDEIVVVAVRSKGSQDFSSPDGATLVGDLTDRLLDVEGVATVTSLVTVPQSLGETRGRLLSADGRTTALVVQTLVGADSEARRHPLLLDIRAAMDEFDLDVYLGGYGVVFDGLNEASTTGAATLIIYAHLMMVVLLALFFRRLLPVLVTLLSVGVAVIWTMALYAATGHQLNMITMVLPTLVLVIGIADCVHILRSVAHQDRHPGRKDRVIAGLGKIIGPCFLTTVTTAAGFLGLTVSGLPVVQQLGWFGATGMIAAFLSSIVLVTAALTWQQTEPVNRRSFVDFGAEKLFAFATGRAKSVIAVFCVLALLAGYGISQLSTDTDSIGYLKRTHPVRRDSDFIEREIGPYVPIEFTVTTDAGIFAPEYLDAVWAWQSAVLKIEQVGWSWSLISAFGLSPDDTPSKIGIERLSGQYRRMRQFSPSAINAMIVGDTEMRVSFGAPIMSAVSVQNLIENIVSRAAFPKELILRPAGYSPLYTRIVDEIVDSQIRGFAAAIILIVVLLGAAMRSWRRIFLALPANAVPVAFTLGLMGLTGIPLDVASATIASVILGLVVDDTVHLLRPVKSAGNIHLSLQATARSAGGTLIMTSMILAGGFMILGLAEIRSIAWFGVLTGFAVIVAILTDLLLLPALARVAQRNVVAP